jgi:hypothetical protein
MTGEPTPYAGGAVIQTPDERRAEELLRTGLVTRNARNVGLTSRLHGNQLELGAFVL